MLAGIADTVRSITREAEEEALRFDHRGTEVEYGDCVVQLPGGTSFRKRNKDAFFQKKKKKQRSGSCDKRRNVRKTRTKQPGAKEKARRKEVRCRVLACQEKSSLTELHEKWCEEFAEDGLGLWESVERSSGHRKLEVEKAEAAAGEKESVSLSLSSWRNNVEVEEDPSTMAALFWAEGVWMGKWKREQQKAWKRQLFEVQTWRHVRSGHVRDSCCRHHVATVALLAI